MNKQKSRQINPEKLLLSKWTAVQPANKEKHFLVTRLDRDEQEIVVACVLEAVINHREIELDWQLLKDASSWLPGWL
ncbi:TIGR02450 family Trp-rich protein [Methylobacter psychrophilus]|uniref:TIGR02450 family Trp-rich protein n=1 Tax=Methylobacter psychrophilus TaxID=96941 RepID=UPI0021D4A847|nr:TIGR02450 family Trp-rich protein [Methylobacter psychrophilus]